MILGRKDVAAGPADIGTEFDKSFDQNGGLNSHVQTAGNFYSGQRFGRTVFFPGGHQSGHFMFGNCDLFPAEVSKRNVFNHVTHNSTSLFMIL